MKLTGPIAYLFDKFDIR